MSVKGIDVSSYQGTIDWKKVKLNGIGFSILKVIRKDLSADKKFERNWTECQKVDIPVIGVYNYSYATTESKARTDAEAVLKILNGRKTTVWLDVEDNCQKNLKSRLISIINAYGKVITDAGLEFGVYTGESFYKSYIKPYGVVQYPLWIARYGKNNGILDTKYQPQINGMVGWQYTSKGTVNGIKGNADLNVWYKELRDTNEPNASVHSIYKEPTRLLYYKKIPMMHGEDVKWAQERLYINGYLKKNEIDGWFGKKTHNATVAFQADKKIAPDGKIGVVTREYMKK